MPIPGDDKGSPKAECLREAASGAPLSRCPAAPGGHPPSVTGAGALRTRAALRVSAGSAAGSSARSGGGGRRKRRMRTKKAPSAGAAAMAAALSNGALPRRAGHHGKGGSRSREIWRRWGRAAPREHGGPGEGMEPGI